MIFVGFINKITWLTKQSTTLTLSQAQESEMKIYWKKLIWSYTIRYWWILIHFMCCISCKNDYIKKLFDVKDGKHKGDTLFWSNYHSRRDKKIWNSKQMAECQKTMAEFLLRLDDVIRRATERDSHLTTVVSTTADQKIYKGGKVVAMEKSLSQQSNN